MIRALLAPRLLGLHALALLATAAAVLLGVWQYGVWQTGRLDLTLIRSHAAARPLDSLLTPDGAFPADSVGRPVHLSGRWLPASTLYVAHRTLHGRSGVWAVTPVAVCSRERSCAGAPAILVVRGWSRGVHTAPAPPTGSVRVTGWLQPGETSGDTDPNPTDDVIPQLDVADAVQHVRGDLYGGYVITRSATPAAGTSAAAVPAGARSATLLPLTPASLPKPPTFTSVRNLLYAGQWWVFGGFAVYLWWRWCRDEVSRVTGVASSA